MWRASVFAVTIMQEYFCIESDSPNFKLLVLVLQVLYLRSEAFKVLQCFYGRVVRLIGSLTYVTARRAVSMTCAFKDCVYKSYT